MNSAMKVLDTAGKPIAVGAVGATTYGLMYGFSSSANIAGMNINGALLFGTVAGVASLGGQATKNYVVPMVTSNPFAEQLVMAAAPVGTGLSTAALTYGVVALNGGSVSSSGILTGFGIGAVSEMVGDYAWRAFILPATVNQ